MFKHLIPVCALLLASAPAHAIVSMEDLHLGTPKDGFSGHLELTAGGSSGNSDTTDIGIGSRLQWHQQAQTDYLLLHAAYGESNGVRDTEQWFAHARHIQGIHTSLDWEAFVQGSHDKFARLSFRGLLGGGLRLHLGDNADHSQVILGLGGYYSREELSDGGYADSGIDTTWRGNAYLVLKAGISANTTLISTTYYQPDLAEWDDYRLLEQAGLKVAINERLALSLALDISHDSRPPVAVENTNVTYKTALSFDF